MFALLGRGEVTPLGSIQTRDHAPVRAGDHLVFTPLAARLLAEVAEEASRWSAKLGLTRTRICTPGPSGGHETEALTEAELARDRDHLGVFQVAEKRREESTLTPLIRMPAFLMWEAFTLADRENDWLAVADAALEWLSRMTYTEVLGARSENTLDPSEPAQEYVLLAATGDQGYTRVYGEGYANAAFGAAPAGGIAALPGFELGNSYSLGRRGGWFAAAHSIGIDRLVAAMLMMRPPSLLDWTRGPLAITGTCCRSDIDTATYWGHVMGPDLTIMASGDGEDHLRGGAR